MCWDAPGACSERSPLKLLSSDVPSLLFSLALILQGDMDPKTPLAGAQAHLRVLPAAAGVKLFTVKGGPHFLLFTAPDCFKAAVSAFVQQRRAPRAACSI